MNRLVRPVSRQDHFLGKYDAPIKLVEYGDYQCPLCRDAHKVIQNLLNRRPDDFCYVFRNFPLFQAHPMARIAARAAEAAALQDRFWPMHHALFENQQVLSEETIVAIAGELGLDERRFIEDWIERDSVGKRVREDFLEGAKSGVSGTPGFFINGEKYFGAWDEPSLSKALDRVIESSKKSAA